MTFSHQAKLLFIAVYSRILIGREPTLNFPYSVMA